MPSKQWSWKHSRTRVMLEALRAFPKRSPIVPRVRADKESQGGLEGGGQRQVDRFAVTLFPRIPLERLNVKGEPDGRGSEKNATPLRTRLPRGPDRLRRSQPGGHSGGPENLPSRLGKDPASPKFGRASKFARGSLLKRLPLGRGGTHPHRRRKVASRCRLECAV